MKLFEDKIRNRSGPARAVENSYTFYDETIDERHVKIRHLLNSWFEKVHPDHQNELKSSLKKHFYSTFFELFLHQLFNEMGYKIVIHPTLDNSHKTPDFLIRKDGVDFYLEAKVDTDVSDEETAHNNRLKYLFDGINKLKASNFYIRIEKCVLKTKHQPNESLIKSKIKNWLNDLVIEKVESFRKNNGVNHLPKLRIDDEFIDLSIVALPINKMSRGKTTGKLIGMYPVGSFWGGPELSLQKSILKKVRKYNKIKGKPFIVAINSLSIKGTTKEEVLRAVYGVANYTKSSSKDTTIPLFADSLIMDNSGNPKNTHVSGFFITKVDCYNLRVADHWLLLHPFAKNPIVDSLGDMGYFYLDRGGIIHKSGRSINQILFNLHTL